jgi:hypothetical protein
MGRTSRCDRSTDGSRKRFVDEKSRHSNLSARGRSDDFLLGEPSAVPERSPNLQLGQIVFGANFLLRGTGGELPEDDRDGRARARDDGLTESDLRVGGYSGHDLSSHAV